MEYSTKASAPMQEPAKGIRRWILATGDKMMLVMIEMEEGAVVPWHSHYHEQIGFVLRGRVEFKTSNGTYVFDEGTAYLFRSNEPHEARNPGPGHVVVLEIFSPPREDFLKK